MGHGTALRPWHNLNADGVPPSRNSQQLSRRPDRAFSVRVLGLGILAIVVLSRGFLDSFLSVTWGPAEGFGSLSCSFLWFGSSPVWGISILGAMSGGFCVWILGVWFFTWRGDVGGKMFGFIGFVLSITSTTWGFVYLETINTWLQKKKKNDQGIGSSRNHLSTFPYSRYLLGGSFSVRYCDNKDLNRFLYQRTR